MSGYRPPYTIKEEKKILDYIIQNQYYYRLRGETMWKEMEEEKILERTWQSMHQHFRKKLINNVTYPVYDIPKEEQEKIRAGYNTMARTNREKEEAKEKKPSDESTSSVTSIPQKKEVDFHVEFSSDEDN